MSRRVELRRSHLQEAVATFCGLVLALACAGKATSSKLAGESGSGTVEGSGGGSEAALGGSAGRLGHDSSSFPCSLDETCTASGQRPEATPKPSCPESLPPERSACHSEGIACSYGASVTAYCRTYVSCVSDVWTTPDNRKDVCLTQPTGFCPTEPAQGASCTVGDVDVFVPCEYPGGIACYCLGNPVGITGAHGAWECYAPPTSSACPALLPNIGDGCDTNGQSCHYGIVQQGCFAPYADVFCYQGAWEVAQAVCTL
jgi:hypothetical protein